MLGRPASPEGVQDTVVQQTAADNPSGGPSHDVSAVVVCLVHALHRLAHANVAAPDINLSPRAQANLLTHSAGHLIWLYIICLQVQALRGRTRWPCQGHFMQGPCAADRSSISPSSPRGPPEAGLKQCSAQPQFETPSDLAAKLPRILQLTRRPSPMW